MKNRNFGTFWRLAWSSEWATLTPWSLDGVDMPYIGARRGETGSVKMRVIGPLALISVTI